MKRIISAVLAVSSIMAIALLILPHERFHRTAPTGSTDIRGQVPKTNETWTNPHRLRPDQVSISAADPHNVDGDHQVDAVRGKRQNASLVISPTQAELAIQTAPNPHLEAFDKDCKQALVDLKMILEGKGNEWRSRYLGSSNIVARQEAEKFIEAFERRNPQTSLCQLGPLSSSESGRKLLESYLERTIVTPTATITGTLTGLSLYREITGAPDIVLQLAPLSLLEKTNPELARTCIALYLGGLKSNG